MRAIAPSVSRLLNAEEACSIMGLADSIHPPVTIGLHSILVIRPVPVFAYELSQLDVFVLFLAFDTVSREVTGTRLTSAWVPLSRNCSWM